MSKRRITLDLDEELLAGVDAAAGERDESRNGFITAAVQRLLKDLDRQRIDAAFERMADDPEYRAELLRIEKELAPGSDAAGRMLDEAERRAGVQY